LYQGLLEFVVPRGIKPTVCCSKLWALQLARAYSMLYQAAACCIKLQLADGKNISSVAVCAPFLKFNLKFNKTKKSKSRDFVFNYSDMYVLNWARFTKS
jgi:hypothetical protein